MIETDHQINAVRRRVGTRVLDEGEARVTAISQTYDAPVEDVWDACTNPERIPRWFLPISGDLRLKGRYQLEGNAGGVIETCDPPRGFTATWEFGGGTSWIEVSLDAEPGGGTRFTLEHIAQVGDDLWAQFGPGAVGVGWDLALVGLALHLSSGQAVSQEDGLAWTLSEEGRRFIALSSQGWREASVAAGTDEAEAREAESRTTAFYAPPQEPGA
ncbi:SRPBCC family protein [Streptosporangium saharense]|uniref:SRPBCC family protein n=1 Tax=Streptosporangium saharense TaxID=1706840 RepID=UPI003316E5EB